MASIDQRYYGPLETAEAGTAIEQLRSGAEVLPEKSLAKRPLAGDTPPPTGRKPPYVSGNRPVGGEGDQNG